MGNAPDREAPRPNAVSVALVRDGRVLLVKRARPPYRGLWTLPGGRIEPGESPEGAARRETEEELGLRIALLQPLTETILETPVAWCLKVFVASAFDGEICPNNEVAGWQWCGRELDGLATTPGLVDVVAQALGRIERE